MRIKKKDVLIESLLIDVSTEFTDVEKRLLKLLKKRYGIPFGGESTFNQWEVAVWLIETLELPYDVAYEITKNYYWNYDKLFSDVEKVRKTIPISEIFFDNINTLLRSYISINGEHYGSIRIKLDGDTIETNREVSLWSKYHGLSLYIPFDTWSHPTTGTVLTIDDVNQRLIYVNTEFKPILLRGDLSGGFVSDKQYVEDIDNEIFSILVEYTVGEKTEDTGKKLMEFTMPYPKPLSIESFNNLIKNIVDTILKKLQSTKIKLPSVAEPI